MSDSNNTFRNTVESLFKGMDSFITTKTVVGDAIHIGDTIILPLVDVSFGVGAGAFSQEKKNNGAGGMGGKITPKILDMVPDFVNKFASRGKKDEAATAKLDEESKKAAESEMNEILSDAVNKDEE